MNGARQLTGTKGLNGAYGIPEQTELELASSEETDSDQELYQFRDSDWDELIGKNLTLRLKIKALAREAESLELLTWGILRLLDCARGLPVVPF